MEQENTTIQNNNITNFENNPILVLVLGIITCGLYLIYWNYKVATVLNEVNGRKAINEVVAVLSGFCTPLNIYFYYLIGNDGLPGVYKRLQKENKDQTVLLMIIGFIFPMVAAMIVQGEINKLYE